MNAFRRFWTQPCRPYRDFQLAFSLIALHFFFPALGYVFAPQVAADQFSRIGEILGAGPYPGAAAEAASRVWRYLGAANVMTLALLCVLMQWNLRRHAVMLLPLCFLKGYNALLFLLDGYLRTGYPAFLAVALFDGLICVAFVFFSRRALTAMQDVPDVELVPAPRGGAS